MKHRFFIAALGIFLGVTGAAHAQLSPNVSVFATGLDGPRGLKFGPDGFLYVAEAGHGGDRSTVGSCEQVPGPVGPYHGGLTARISRIDFNGNRTTLVDNLPSAKSSLPSGDTLGVADLAFVDGKLFALIAGAGCSHGLAGTSNAVVRVHRNGNTTLIADLSAFQKAHPVANPDLEDFEPDGTWYSMVAVGEDLYAVEPNHQEIDRICIRTGEIQRLIDVSAFSPGWVGPTAIAYDRHFFFGNLGPFPIKPGTESIFELAQRGWLRVVADQLTTVLGLAFDEKGRLYVLESMTAPGFNTPDQVGTGKIVRIDKSGVAEPIATGLSLPTAMTFGPDGALYVSDRGAIPLVGPGQILRVVVPE
jgi:hypothetical protein